MPLPGTQGGVGVGTGPLLLLGALVGVILGQVY